MALRSMIEAMRAPWLTRAGLMKAADVAKLDYGYSAGWVPKWQNPLGGPDISGVGISSTGQITLGGQLVIPPVLVPAVYMMETNAAIVDQVFYIANQAMRVVSITEKHRVLGSSTPTAVVKKCTSGQTIAQGTSVMSGSFDLHATAETLQTATLASDQGTITLAAGDRLAFDITGTTTALAGVLVTVMLQPLDSPTTDITFSWASNTQLIDLQFFIANAPYTVTAVRWAHSTASSAATNIQLTKDTSTDAPGGGTDLLTNNTNAGFAADGTVNIPQTGALVTTAGVTTLAIGDRLALDFAATPTLLAGVVCTVSLTPIANRTEINFYLPSTWAANTDRSFFTADRNYTAYCSSEIHAVAAGGASTAQLTKDVGTDATGAGVDLLTGADDLNSTSQTVDSDLLLTTLGYRNLQSGNRLSYDFGAAVQSSSGLLVTVSMFGA